MKWDQIDWAKRCFILYTSPCVQTGSRLPGTVWRGLIFFTTDRPHCILKCPHFPGTITAEWFWLCLRSQCHHICMFGVCAHLMKTAVRYELRAQGRSPPLRTQHVWWDHREKSRRASTLWDCRGKSHLAGLSPANGDPVLNAGEYWYNFKNVKYVLILISWYIAQPLYVVSSFAVCSLINDHFMTAICKALYVWTG